MSVGRNVVRHDDGTCKIGVKIWASVPMLTVDAIVNILLVRVTSQTLIVQGG